jgi:hypothetical protein
MMRLILAGICGAAILTPAEMPGIKARPEVSDYAAHETGSKLTIAAEILSPAQVSNAFVTDLNKGWIVIEVAIYPTKDPVTVDASDFMLRAGGDERKTILRPASPKAIAGILQRKESKESARSDSDVTLYPSVGVGYESGPGYYDPVTGTRRGGGGVRTSVGVGVGMGQTGAPPAPASTPADRNTMETELGDKTLPEGATAKPVAGYLYFPRPAGKLKDGPFELQHSSDDGTVKVLLPAARRERR